MREENRAKAAQPLPPSIASTAASSASLAPPDAASRTSADTAGAGRGAAARTRPGRGRGTWENDPRRPWWTGFGSVKCANPTCRYPAGSHTAPTHCCVRCQAAHQNGGVPLDHDPRTKAPWKQAHGPACTGRHAIPIPQEEMQAHYSTLRAGAPTWQQPPSAHAGGTGWGPMGSIPPVPLSTQTTDMWCGGVGMLGPGFIGQPGPYGPYGGGGWDGCCGGMQPPPPWGWPGCGWSGWPS